MEENKVTGEKTNGWLVALSILIPIAGLIIFLTQKDKQPKTAKVCGICALIHLIVSIVIGIVVFITLISFGITIFNDAQDVILNDNGLDITTPSERRIIEKSKEATAKTKIGAAEDIVMINVSNARLKYMEEKSIGDENTDISKYLIDALKKAKKELSDKEEVSLSASKNKIYLSYDKYRVTGTVSDEGKITWSDIEEK